MEKNESESILLTPLWRLYQVSLRLPSVVVPGIIPMLDPNDWRQWRSDVGIPAGTPFLLGPRFEYDVQLNEFFYSVDMLNARLSTRVGYARDLKGFLNFLTVGRDGTSWRDASEEDHRAYMIWRREDPEGPRISPSTWNREVAAVSRFYRWQTARGHVKSCPIPQRQRRSPAGFSRRTVGSETAATYSHGAHNARMQWLPARSYRVWRDVGLRGYDADGMPDPHFRGRWADRNALFADLMVRTGLRLAEQSSLTIYEIPKIRAQSGYHRFWLPGAIAKSGSARWIYVPSAILRELHSYLDLDRRLIVARAQARGRYETTSGNFILLDDLQPTKLNPGERQTKLSQLTPGERRRLLVIGPNGPEPAALWLSEDGLPLSASTWKDIFRQANDRCARNSIDLRAHPHMLRHSFAVLTLEQLQRGHISALSDLNPSQRGHYTRVFGDPLDWVRRRLGHKSVTTTQIYLHALEELEMETRMALTSDNWEDPRLTTLVANLSPTDDEARS